MTLLHKVNKIYFLPTEVYDTKEMQFYTFHHDNNSIINIK
jgi:hypothetical protein